MVFSGGSQIGPYTLIHSLGRGGFGEVWLGERTTKFVTTRVAVKLPHNDQVDPETIRQEAMLWEKASGHPNVLPIIDADEYDGQIVIVSEYAPDGSLDQWLKQNGSMAPAKAVELMVKILDGLEFLHSRGIIHRDLKPANILLQGNTPRLADFGISRALRTTVSSQSSNISGTFAYMPPEGFDGKRSIRTDIWAAGINLYQFLTGRLPFPQGEPSVLIAAIMMREYEPLPAGVPEGLKLVISRALAKLPEDRYPTAEAMREDLARSFYGEVTVETVQRPAVAFVPAPTELIEHRSTAETEYVQAEQETVVRSLPSFVQEEAKERSGLWIYAVAVIGLGLLSAGLWYGVGYLRSLPSSTAENAPAANANSNATPSSGGSSSVTPFGAVPDMSTLKVEFKALKDPVSLSSTSDGKSGIREVTPGSSAIFEPKESLKLSYSKSLAALVQMTINGKAITLPAQPLIPNRNMIEFEINKDNLGQIWRNGAISAEAPVASGEATPDRRPGNANANPQSSPPATPAKPVSTPQLEEPAPRTPKTISGGTLNGRATSLPTPSYPAAARAVRAGGQVSVQVLVDESGKVVSASAVSGHPLLRSAAESAARGARFSPTVASGQPVKVSGVLTYNFVP